jgi:RNA polymerase sigma factor (sigma-70 family)
MTTFRELRDFELAQLSEAQLLTYVRRAAAADRRDAVTLATQVLAFGRIDGIRARVRAKLPSHLVDDVTHDVLLAAITSDFDGSTAREFGAWLRVITDRRIADFYRGRQGRQLEHDRQGAAVDHVDQPGAVRDAQEEPGYARIEVDALVEAVLARRSALHRRIVELYVLEGCSASEIAQATGANAANVYKIAERFRTDLRAELQAGPAPIADDRDPEAA